MLQELVFARSAPTQNNSKFWVGQCKAPDDMADYSTRMRRLSLAEDRTDRDEFLAVVRSDKCGARSTRQILLLSSQWQCLRFEVKALLRKQGSRTTSRELDALSASGEGLR